MDAAYAIFFSENISEQNYNKFTQGGLYFEIQTHDIPNARFTSFVLLSVYKTSGRRATDGKVMY
jgi:hypothetical protein